MGDLDRPDLRARPLRRDGRADRAGQGRRRHGGIYASHIRNEGAGLLESIDEAIAIGKGAGDPGAHLAPEGQRQGRTGARSARRSTGSPQAREAGQASRPTSIPTSPRAPSWRRWSSRTGPSRGTPTTSPGSPPTRERGAELRREIARSARRARRRRLDPDRAVSPAARVGRARPGRDRRAREGTTPLEVVLEIQRHGGAQAISFGMSEDDVREVMRHDFVATASDGSTHLPGRGDQPHPRAYGTFPRKIRYALDDKVLTLEQAIRSCSGWPAEILGLARSRA